MGLPHPESFMITSPNKYLGRMQVPTVHKNIIKELLIQTLGLCCRNVAIVRIQEVCHEACLC